MAMRTCMEAGNGCLFPARSGPLPLGHVGRHITKTPRSPHASKGKRKARRLSTPAGPMHIELRDEPKCRTYYTPAEEPRCRRGRQAIGTRDADWEAEVRAYEKHLLLVRQNRARRGRGRMFMSPGVSLAASAEIRDVLQRDQAGIRIPGNSKHPARQMAVEIAKKLKFPAMAAVLVQQLMSNASVASHIRAGERQVNKKYKRSASARAVRSVQQQLHDHQERHAFFVLFSDFRQSKASFDRFRLAVGLETVSSARAKGLADVRLRPYYVWYFNGEQADALVSAQASVRSCLSRIDREWRSKHHSDFNGGREIVSMDGYSNLGIDSNGRDTIISQFDGHPPLAPELRGALIKQMMRHDPNVPVSFSADDDDARPHIFRRSQVAKLNPISPRMYPCALAADGRRLAWIKDPEKCSAFMHCGKLYHLGGDLVENTVNGKGPMLRTNPFERLQILLADELNRGTLKAVTAETFAGMNMQAIKQVLHADGCPHERKLPCTLAALKVYAVRIYNTFSLAFYADGSDLNKKWGYTIVTVSIIMFGFQWSVQPGTAEYGRVKKRLTWDVEIDIMALCGSDATTSNALLSLLSKQLLDIPNGGLPLESSGPVMKMRDLVGTGSDSGSSSDSDSGTAVPHVHFRAVICKGDIPELLHRMGLGGPKSLFPDPFSTLDRQQILYGPCVVTATLRTLKTNTDFVTPLPDNDNSRTYQTKSMVASDWKRALEQRTGVAQTNGTVAYEEMRDNHLFGTSMLSGILLGDPSNATHTRIKYFSPFSDGMHNIEIGIIGNSVLQIITDGGRLRDDAAAARARSELKEMGVYHEGSNNRGIDRVLQALAILAPDFGVAIPDEDADHLKAALEMRKVTYSSQARVAGAQLEYVCATIEYERASETAFGDDTKVRAGSTHAGLMASYRSGILHSCWLQRFVEQEQTLCEANEAVFKGPRSIVKDSNMHVNDCMDSMSRSLFAKKVNDDLNVCASAGMHNEESRVAQMYARAGLGKPTMADGVSAIYDFDEDVGRSAMYIFTMLAHADIIINSDRQFYLVF